MIIEVPSIRSTHKVNIKEILDVEEDNSFTSNDEYTYRQVMYIEMHEFDRELNRHLSKEDSIDSLCDECELKDGEFFFADAWLCSDCLNDLSSVEKQEHIDAAENDFREELVACSGCGLYLSEELTMRVKRKTFCESCFNDYMRV